MTSPKEDQQPMTTREELVGHTPGPWVVGDNGRMVLRDVPGMCDGHDGYAVAVTSAHSLLSVEEAEANARLIAAAPAMLNYIARKAAEGDEDARALLAKYSITKRS